MRMKYRQWRNGPGGDWDSRITWYGEGQARDQNIRLEMQDCERTVNYYPATKAEADHAWFMFRQGAPQEGQPAVPFVTDLLKLLERAYPKETGNASTYRP